MDSYAGNGVALDKPLVGRKTLISLKCWPPTPADTNPSDVTAQGKSQSVQWGILRLSQLFCSLIRFFSLIQRLGWDVTQIAKCDIIEYGPDTSSFLQPYLQYISIILKGFCSKAFKMLLICKAYADNNLL